MVRISVLVQRIFDRSELYRILCTNCVQNLDGTHTVKITFFVKQIMGEVNKIDLAVLLNCSRSLLVPLGGAEADKVDFVVLCK